MVETYYTFRPLNDYTFECAKWNEGDIRPHVIYKVNTSTWRCNCPATSRECKHVSCVKQIKELKTDFQMYNWKWDEKNEWTKLSDIVPVEELMQ